MKISIYIILILTLNFIPRLIQAQYFQISNIPSRDCTIDNFSEDIYLEDFYTNKVWKVNIKTLVEEEAIFPTLPVFANTSHKAVYFNYKDNTVYMYDFEKDTSISLFKKYLSYWANGSRTSFSPNDKKVIIADDIPVIYDFEKYMEYNGEALKYSDFTSWQWSSDSSILSYDNGRPIVEYYPETGRIDTLILSDNYRLVTGFSYNLKNKKLYYSMSIHLI